VARFGPDPCSIVPDSGARAAIEPLPIGALDVPPDVVASFEELGVTTIAELLRLPRSELPSRFGEELLLRIDLALGNAVEIIDPVKPLIPIRVEQLFDGPTTQVESIELAAHELLAALVAQLETAESGVSRLVATLDRIAAEPIRIILTLGRPSRNIKHLWTLMRPRLEDANLGFGVERIEFTAARTGRLRHRQTACWATPDQSGAESDAAFWEFADTVIARLGPKSVLRPETRSTHLPERAIRLRPVVDPPSRSPPPAANASGGDDAPAGFVPHRPSLLLEIPEPIEVIALTPDGPVSRVVHDGAVHSVTQCAGPERLSPEWWRLGVPDAESPSASLATRDYFRLHTDSARVLWVFKELETGKWFLHGEWT
jgi:protein ImuB